MAVSSEHQAINIEPLEQQSKKYDDNGEEIIFEGIFYKRGFRTWACWYICFYPGASLLGMFIGMFVCIWCWFKGAKNWQLYLTHDNICYTSAGCSTKTTVINISDIDEIFVTSDKEIYVGMEPSKINKYIGHWCFRPICRQVRYLVLSYVANNNEFVDAVKREMASK